MYHPRHCAPVPYSRTRTALWVIVAFTWPAVRVLRIATGIRWGDSLANAGAGVTLTSAVGAKYVVGRSGAHLAAQVAHLTERVNDWDRAAAILARPALRVVNGGRRLGALAQRTVLLQQRRNEPLP